MTITKLPYTAKSRAFDAVKRPEGFRLKGLVISGGDTLRADLIQFLSDRYNHPNRLPLREYVKWAWSQLVMLAQSEWRAFCERNQ